MKLLINESYDVNVLMTWRVCCSGETFVTGVTGRRMCTAPPSRLCSKCAGALTSYADDDGVSRAMSYTDRLSARSHGTDQQTRQASSREAFDERFSVEFTDDPMSPVSHQHVAKHSDETVWSSSVLS